MAKIYQVLPHKVNIRESQTFTKCVVTDHLRKFTAEISQIFYIVKFSSGESFPRWIMFKVNSKVTSTTPWRCFKVFIINFEHIYNLAPVFLLLTGISTVKQVIVGWII